jgi:signal transduction histidine kinase/CheY-like chemotaxis protein
MKDKSSFFIKTEVIISYLLLIFLAACAIFIIYRGIDRLTTPDWKQTVHREKIQYVNEILTGLYDAEISIGAAIADTSAFNLYSRKMDFVKTKIDTLTGLSRENTLQVNQLDTILILLDEKEANLKNIISLLRKSSLDELYKKNMIRAIENEIPKQQQTVEKKVIVKQDTILQNKPSTAPRKNFFQRIFSSSEKSDTTIEIHSTEYTIIDSLVSFYDPADSINKIFTNIQHNIQSQKGRMEEALFANITSLHESNDLISVKMNNILRNFEKEEFNHSIRLLGKREETIAGIVKTVARIAIIAFLAIAFFIFLIWKNISENRLYRKKLEEANHTTQKLLESREKLMLSITHDIKAPLSSVIGYIELLSNSKLTERQIHYLENMKGSSEHSLSLINDILDFNRLNSGEVKLNVLPFNEKKLFEDIVTGFLPLAQKKGLQIRFNHQSKIDSSKIIGDPIRIRQITNNLLSNAIKFTQKGEVQLNVRILPQDTNLSFLQIEVSDTGIGISKENRKRIFQEYSRIESGEQSAEGFGLGLPIVQKLVEIQKGKITFSSTEGKGSSFVITLPLPVPSKETDAKTPLFPSTPRILIIDDDPSQLTMISEQLKQKGITATTCKTPITALEMIEKEHFDIIFTDIQMPELNGFELIKHIRRITETPVVALSARADIHLPQFKTHGFTSFLSKPFTVSQLFSVVTECLSTAVPDHKEIDSTTATGENRFQSLLCFASGEKESERAILQSFVDESKKNVENLLSMKRKKNIIGINQLAHKMLPLFRMMNEKEIVEWLIALEKTKSLKFLEEKSFNEKIEQVQHIIIEGEKILDL